MVKQSKNNMHLLPFQDRSPLSGSKSGLSLYANQLPFNPPTTAPLARPLLPITALQLTMPSKINIKPSGRQKRSDIRENRRGMSRVEY